MPRKKSRSTHKYVNEPEDLENLTKEELVAFLRSNRSDKRALWDQWRREEGWAESVDLTSSDLSNLDLAGIDFIEIHLEGTNLSYSNLKGAFLWEAYLTGANLTGCDLRLAHLRDADLESVSGLQGIKLYQTYLGGVLSLNYEQLLDAERRSTIWEETEGRFDQAKDVYKSLKGHFEDAGDYEGANWAYEREQYMKKLMYAPQWARWLYPRWCWQPDEEGKIFWKPNSFAWFSLEVADKLAGYGLSVVKPLIWLFILILSCSGIYGLGGMVTNIPGCGFADLAATVHAHTSNPSIVIPSCDASHNMLHSFLFSLGAMTTIDVGNVQPYREYVGVLAALEAVFGIILTGLLGFVLGNRLRNS